jgi:hypothetical protein
MEMRLGRDISSTQGGIDVVLGGCAELPNPDVPPSEMKTQYKDILASEIPFLWP